jgi:hypothetical protein
MYKQMMENTTPTSDARPRSDSIGHVMIEAADKTETLKVLYMPRKISF